MNSHKFAGLIPPNLIRIIQEGKCVLFVGAGVSAQAKTDAGVHLPTWGSLLSQMIDWCIDNGVDLRADKSELLDVLAKKRFLTVAQELQDRIGPRLNSCLSEILHSGKIRPSDAHKLIPETPWVAVLTSNYDSLIEGAYALNLGGIVPPVYSQDSFGSALDCLRNKRHFIFKVHGDVNIPGTIILGNRDYSRLLYLSPGYRSFLETIFATYTVLFVGFGGDDPDLNDITDKLSTVYERSIAQHFMLVSSDTFSLLERRRLLDDKRLDCITYEKDATHSQVVEFLKALAIRTQPDSASTPSPFSSTKPAYRVFISGSYKQLPLLRELASLAREAGFDPWFAESQIQAGDLIQDVISQAIVDSDCMIFVITEDSIQSSWVDFELGRAFAASKLILPLRVGNSPVPMIMERYLYLHIDSVELTQEDRRKIILALRQLINRAKFDK